MPSAPQLAQLEEAPVARVLVEPKTRVAAGVVVVDLELLVGRLNCSLPPDAVQDRVGREALAACAHQLADEAAEEPIDDRVLLMEALEALFDALALRGLNGPQGAEVEVEEVGHRCRAHRISRTSAAGASSMSRVASSPIRATSR